jgi:hypothetical protein
MPRECLAAIEVLSNELSAWILKSGNTGTAEETATAVLSCVLGNLVGGYGFDDEETSRIVHQALANVQGMGRLMRDARKAGIS